jgi:tetratricopeptide (TPR) repeat protein
MKPSNKIMTDLNRLLKTQDFKDEKELQAFLNSMVGQTVPEFEPEALSNEEMAEDLVFEAYDLDADNGIANVLEALSLDPDCITAYEYLGTIQPISHLALPYYAYGIQIGRKKFAKEMIEDRGHFWGIHEIRPFMRCLNNYASCLVGMGHSDKALEVYKEILELNENDNMGVRNQYGLFLILATMFDDFMKLDEKFGYEKSAMLCFNRVLYCFMTQGETQVTNELLKKAKEQNKHLVGVLTAKKSEKDLPDSYELGSRNEALIYADFAYDAWHDVAGAVEFLIKNKK